MKARSQTAAVDCGRNTDRLLNKFNEVVMVEVLEMEIWVGCLHFGLMLEQLSKWWTVFIFSALAYIYFEFCEWNSAKQIICTHGGGQEDAIIICYSNKQKL